jgi:hypothetical protein
VLRRPDRPGLVVTAAHCVAGYGTRSFYANWRFQPSYNKGREPYGTSTAVTAWVMTSYLNGSEPCAVYGVVCPNDVAVIVLNPVNGAYVGETTGWLSYGYNGYGFNSTNNALITQLGYSSNLDDGEFMQRTDSQAFVWIPCSPATPSSDRCRRAAPAAAPGSSTWVFVRACPEVCPTVTMPGATLWSG